MRNQPSGGGFEFRNDNEDYHSFFDMNSANDIFKNFFKNDK